jgi:hypothetical protein
MHPFVEYETIRKGYEELLKQAEQERMARHASVRHWVNSRYYRGFASWLGTRMRRWGQKLKNLGKRGQPTSLWPASPHH